MIRELSGWWSGCDGVCVWLGEVEETMVSHKPLASSMDIIDQQMKTLQVCETVNNLVPKLIDP